MQQSDEFAEFDVSAAEILAALDSGPSVSFGTGGLRLLDVDATPNLIIDGVTSSTGATRPLAPTG